MLDLQSTGKLGETLATDYLKNKGYSILHRNYRTPLGELDIIAKKNDTICFFEVKTRSSDKKGKPYEAVNFYKLQHLKRAIELYVLQNKLQTYKLSLSVISIIIGQGQKPETIQQYDLTF
jgi:putative endonuclease